MKKNAFIDSQLTDYESRLSKGLSIPDAELPNIPISNMPNRWIQESGKLIHEVFQEKIDQESNVHNKALSIQEQYAGHTFDRKVDLWKINQDIAML